MQHNVSYSSVESYSIPPTIYVEIPQRPPPVCYFAYYAYIARNNYVLWFPQFVPCFLVWNNKSKKKKNFINTNSIRACQKKFFLYNFLAYTYFYIKIHHLYYQSCFYVSQWKIALWDFLTFLYYYFIIAKLWKLLFMREFIN